jgi:hypothetical protein
MPEISPLPEPLYTAIGHMTLAAAQLEWMVAGCMVVIGDSGSPDAETASLRAVSRNVERLRDWLNTDSRANDRRKAWATRWLDDAETALMRRNRIVHSVTVANAREDGEPALLHPRSGEVHLPTADNVNAITEELLRCAGVGIQRQKEFAEIAGYTG